MKKMLGAAVAAGVLTFAGSASAAQIYALTLSGTLVSEISSGGVIDANLTVDDTITLTARFSSERLIEWGTYGYSLAGFYGLQPTGNEFWRIDAPGGLLWRTQDDIHDGLSFYDDYDQPSRTQRIPAIAIQDGKVIGVAGLMSPAGSSARPEIYLGSSTGSGYIPCPGCSEHFTPGSFSSAFAVRAPDGMYGNFYQTQGFNGIWDFAGSSITAVPEPATWAMMIVGFGLVGTVVRRRTRSLAVA